MGRLPPPSPPPPQPGSPGLKSGCRASQGRYVGPVKWLDKQPRRFQGKKKGAQLEAMESTVPGVESGLSHGLKTRFCQLQLSAAIINTGLMKTVFFPQWRRVFQEIRHHLVYRLIFLFT